MSEINGIAKRIKSIRQLNGLTRLEFAKRLDVTLPIIRAFENSKIVIDDRTLTRICDEFHVVRDWLVYGKKTIE
jgi:transcriptional regulator with XRE-family HTH domain